MSQKHYNLFASVDFAWFNQQPPFRDFFSDFFNRWTYSETQMPVSIEGNPLALQMRVKNIARFMSEAQSLAKIGFEKYINDKNLFPNPTPFIDYFGGSQVSMDIYQYELKKYGYPRNMLSYNKDVTYYPSERYWYLAAMNGLWYYADAIDKSLIEYDWKTRPDFQEDNGFFQQVIRNVATPYVEYLAQAGAVVTVATALVAFGTAIAAVSAGGSPALGAAAEGAAAATTTAEAGAVGSTLAEISVTVGAESAAAAGATTAASSSSIFSGIGSLISGETAAATAAATALAESEAKKFFQQQVANAITGEDESQKQPEQAAPITAAPVVDADVKKTPNAAIGAGLLALVLLFI